MKQAATSRVSFSIRELSGVQRGVVIAGAVLIIFFALFRLMSQMGIVGGPDAQAGYYALQINSAPNVQNQQIKDVALGFIRLALQRNGTFRLGELRGNWGRSGSTVTLSPTTMPPADQFFSNTTMAQTLSILLKETTFTVGADGKTLTAENSANGPLVFIKVNEVFGQ